MLANLARGAHTKNNSSARCRAEGFLLERTGVPRSCSGVEHICIAFADFAEKLIQSQFFLTAVVASATMDFPKFAVKKTCFRFLIILQILNIAICSLFTQLSSANC